MADRGAITKLWAEALSDRTDERMTALAGALADDVVTVSALGTAEGKEAVLASFGQSPIAAFFAQGQWSEPKEDGDGWTIACRFPTAAPVGGVRVHLTFDASDRVSRAASTVEQAPPPTAIALKLTDSMKEAVNGALMGATPVVVAYVDGDGRPRLSLRGSTQAYSDDQLAIWVRNPEGGILRAIGTNPNVSLFYRDPGTRTSYQFWGRAHAETAGDVREKVYAGAPAPEQSLDPQKRGVPIVVDLDRIEGRDANGPVVMERQ